MPDRLAASRRYVPVPARTPLRWHADSPIEWRESFSDAAIAEQVDVGFLAIKADREEWPDIDLCVLRAP